MNDELGIPSVRPGVRKALVAGVAGVVAVVGVMFGANLMGGPTSVCRGVPSTIDRTGRQNVTQALSDVFRGLQDGSCLRFPRRASGAGARYRVDRLVLEDKVRVRIFANGATFVRTGHGDHGPFFEIRESIDVLVRNLRLKGVEEDCVYNSNPPDATEFEAGVQVMWSENVRLENLTVLRHSGDGAFVGWGTQPDGGWAHGQIPPGTITPENPGGIPVIVPQSKDIRITGSTFDCVARQGMAIAWTDGIVVEGNRLDRVGQSGIDLEHFGVSNASFLGNSFGRVRDQLFISSVPLENLEFSNNHSDEPIYMVIRGAGATNALFFGNVGEKVMGNDGTIFADPFLRVETTSNGIRMVGNVQKFTPHILPLAFQHPRRIQIPGTSLNAITGLCTAYAERNDFSGASELWRPPAQFPLGCAWTNGGGNQP